MSVQTYPSSSSSNVASSKLHEMNENVDNGDKHPSVDSSPIRERSNSEPIQMHNTPDAPGNDHLNSYHNNARAFFKLIRQELTYIGKASKDLIDYKGHVDEQLKQASEKLRDLEAALESISPYTQADMIDFNDDLLKFKKSVTRLKMQLPSKLKIHSVDSDTHLGLLSDGVIQGKRYKVNDKLFMMPSLLNSATFSDSSAFKDFRVLCDSLEIDLKLCLLCFSVFPENAIISRRLLVHWWIAEGFLTHKGQKKDEVDVGNDYFDKLMEMGFIYPLREMHYSRVNSCKMHSFIRSAVIVIAKRAKFFDFDDNGSPTENFSSSLRACLMNRGIENSEEFDKLHMLFNVNETILDFKLDWFLKMKNINILYLGRWESSAKHHIEVEDTKFLEGLRNMRHLKFLSLQGISRITELPNSVVALGNLTILDLRACHSLEVLPEKIGSLKRLRHLDMSECYLLDHMPKDLSTLAHLQVLKGFVVGDSKNKNSCTLDDLAKLQKLRKLSIYTGLKDFPAEKDLHAFKQFNALRKLAIAWGGGAHASFQQGKDSKGKSETTSAQAKDAPSKLDTRANRVKGATDTLETGVDSPSRKSERNSQQENDELNELGTSNKQEKVGDKLKSCSAQAQGAADISDTSASQASVEMGSNTILEKGALTEPGIVSKKEKVSSDKCTSCATQAEGIPCKSNSNTIHENSLMGKLDTNFEQVKFSLEPEASDIKNQENKSDGGKQGKEKKDLGAPADKQEVQKFSRDADISNRNKSGDVMKKGRRSKGQPRSPAAALKHSVSKLMGDKASAYDSAKPTGLPEKLEKLDLKCFPQPFAPHWLKPVSLKNLKKLYIRGGHLPDLGQDQDDQDQHAKWTVNILRLKYLNKLKMDWAELHEMFPELIYLEKVKCPRLSLFPCDVSGVWENKAQSHSGN